MEIITNLIWEPELPSESDDLGATPDNNISICCGGGDPWYGVDFTLTSCA